MKKLIVTFLVAICFAAYSIPFKKSLYTTTKSGQQQANELLSGTAFKFRKNMGQLSGKIKTAADKVLYSCKVPGLDLYITTEGLSYFFYKETEPKKHESPQPGSDIEELNTKISWERIEMKLDGAHISAGNIIAEEQSSEMYNYFTAAHPNGIYNVREYEALTIRDVYPGVDWVLYNSKRSGFKYDFIIHPGADASLIKLKYRSLEAIAIDPSGSLHLQTKFGSLAEQAPYSYIKENGEEINSSYQIGTTIKNEDIFETVVSYRLLGEPGTDKTIVIDPVLFWATAYGGTFNDRPKSIDTDNNGNIFVTGQTQSTDFILQNAGTYFQGTGLTNGRAFIMKFSPLNTLIWSTYYGGSSGEIGFSVAVDSLQNIVVSGATYSTDFPTQNSGTFFQGSFGGGTADAFLLKFNNAGTRLWATYYGGSDLEFGFSVCTDNSGNIFMGGITYSPNFPLLNAGTFYYGTPPNQGSNSGFVVKFNNAGVLFWSTYYLCDRINAIATDNNGNLFVTGFTNNSTHLVNPGAGAYFQASGVQSESFIGKFDNLCNLVWATYYGGNKPEYGYSVVADKGGNVFISGVTRSTNLPLVAEGNTYLQSATTSTVASNQWDAFLAKFDNIGVLKWATYYGGTGYEQMGTSDNLEIDACGRLYVSFDTSPPSTNSLNINLMPSCEGGYFKSTDGYFDQFVARFSNSGTLQWATLVGGDGNDDGSALAVDKNGDLFMTGTWDPNTASTYTSVNPGNGAYITSNPGVTPKGSIVKFTGASIKVPAAYSYPVICSDQTGVISPVMTLAFVPGGSFSAPGLTINPGTGLITVNNTAVGTYSVYYIAEQCQCKESIGTFVVQNCDDLGELKEGSQRLDVYANPNAGSFILRSGNPFDGQLINELGQTVLELKLTAENEYRQTITNLSAGVYLVKSSGGKMFKKIVVFK